MVCYACGGETQVTNSRPQKRANQVWRRRRCVLCDTVFTTTEAMNYGNTLMVGSAPKHLQPFNRDRLFLSLFASLQHRDQPLTDAAELCATIMPKLARSAQRGIIAPLSIINTVAVTLQRFDKLAAQHYQALHKSK